MSKNYLWKFFLLTSLYCFSSWAAGVETPHYTQMLQEVFRTELVYPQDKGEVQLSLLPAYFINREAKTISIPLEMEYGITNRWQIDYNASYLLKKISSSPASRGFGDIDVGTKYSFLNIAGSNYHAALLFDVSLPTSNIRKGLTEGFYEYGPSVAFAKDFPQLHNSQFFGQTGFIFSQKGKKIINQISRPDISMEDEEEIGLMPFAPAEPSAHSFVLNMGYFLPLGAARYVIEANWNTNRWNHQGKENILYFTSGVVYELPKRWEIAAGSSIGLTRTSDKIDILLRVTTEFDIL